jgi:hypothetical protein
LARALVSEGNNGAAIRGEPHLYVAVPDPDAVDRRRDQEKLKPN